MGAFVYDVYLLVCILCLDESTPTALTRSMLLVLSVVSLSRSKEPVTVATLVVMSLLKVAVRSASAAVVGVSFGVLSVGFDVVGVSVSMVICVDAVVWVDVADEAVDDVGDDGVGAGCLGVGNVD